MIMTIFSSLGLYYLHIEGHENLDDKLRLAEIELKKQKPMAKKKQKQNC